MTLERDQTLARIAAENFRRLGAANIEVVNTSAEAYLAQPGLHFDWVYADPDRRSGDGRKLVRLEDCSPDILSPDAAHRQDFGTTVRQNSPLFDIGEALRLFPGARVEAVSLGDECKEVVIYADGTGPGITATALGRGSFTATPAQTGAPPHPGRSNRIVTGGSWYPMWRCRKRGWHGCTCAAKPTYGAKTGMVSPRSGQRG